MPGLEKTWAARDSPGMAGKIRGAVKPKGALKPQIQNAITKMQVQVHRLDAVIAKLGERDAQIFQKIVIAMQNHDTNASRVLSNELAEIRKVSRKMSSVRMSLEQVQLRLTTMHELGDAMVELTPAMATMKDLKPALGKFMPGADAELVGMTQALGGMFGETMSGGAFEETQADAPDAETARILEEAEALATAGTEEKFPDPLGGIAQDRPSSTASTFE
ncbi:MAG: Snf7 family protein [Thaumarchaeota archaeon]|nr:Snf7 family protein [Nitrososphaerota archaeon]